MTFEFTASLHFDFITEFSRQIGVPIHDDLLLIPETMGEGYVRKVTFGDDFRLLIHRYNLKEVLTIKRNPSIVPNDLMSIFFYNNEQPLDLISNKHQPVKFARKSESAVQVTTNDLSSIIHFPENTETQYAVVGITSSKLASLIGADASNHIIQTMTGGTSSFLYFESMNAEIQQILSNITLINMNGNFSNFYARIKVQELLYHLIRKLSQRENTSQHPINNADAEKLMIARNIILENLSVPPVLHELSATIGMSETKLKQLFKQTFGDSIYNYYQTVRMEEAAFLLKQAGYSVSEVGYQLGFSNLSHFSRLFQKHYGITPKKYSTVG